MGIIIDGGFFFFFNNQEHLLSCQFITLKVR